MTETRVYGRVLSFCMTFATALTILAPGAHAEQDAWEPDETIPTVLVPGSPQVHSISPAGDLDVYTFTLAGTSDVILETSGPTGDTVMALTTSDVTPIETDDDDGVGLFSRISRTLAAGTYLVGVTGLTNATEILSYTMSLTVTASGNSAGLVIGVAAVVLAIVVVAAVVVRRARRKRKAPPPAPPTAGGAVGGFSPEPPFSPPSEPPRRQ